MAYIALIMSVFLMLSRGIPPAGEVMDGSTEPRMLERAEFMEDMAIEVEQRFHKYENPGPGMIRWILQMIPPLAWINMTLFLLWFTLENILCKHDLAQQLARYIDILELVDIIQELDVPLNWYMLIIHVHCLIFEYLQCHLELATQLRNHMFLVNKIHQAIDFIESYGYSMRTLFLSTGLSILVIVVAYNPMLLVAVVIHSIDSQWLLSSLIYWSWVSTRTTQLLLGGLGDVWGDVEE